MFWRLKESKKSKCYVFSGYKQRNKVWLVYFEWKLQQNRYGWWIFKLKCHQTAKKNIFREKRTVNKVPYMFLDVKLRMEM